MYRFAPFLFLAFFCAQHLHAQKPQPQKVKSWQEQLHGDWKLDSVVMYESGQRVEDPGFLKELNSASLRALPNGKIAFHMASKSPSRESQVYISGYDLLTGKSGRYLLMDISMSVCVRIEDVTEKSLKAEIKTFSYAGEHKVVLYLTKGTFPENELVSSLKGGFLKKTPFSYYSALSKMSSSDYDAEDQDPPALLLDLGADGKMGNYLGAEKDTGTWTFDQESLTIALKGTRSTQKLEIVNWDHRSTIMVHPVNTPKDSVIRLTQRMDIWNEHTVEDTAVTVEQYDTAAVAAPAAIEDHELNSLDQFKLCKSWRAVSIGNDVGQQGGDSVTSIIRLNLLDDGTFTYIEGKKKHQGFWRRVPGQRGLVLTIKGVEQLAFYEFHYDYSMFGKDPDDVYKRRYQGDPDENLIISFIPPKSKTAVTYTFQQQK